MTWKLAGPFFTMGTCSPHHFDAAVAPRDQANKRQLAARAVCVEGDPPLSVTIPPGQSRVQCRTEILIAAGFDIASLPSSLNPYRWQHAPQLDELLYGSLVGI